MSMTTNRETARPDADGADRKLARLLDNPLLARVVPHLAPETLHQLVRHCGLEACGELLASATPAQLTALLDLDLWRRGQPGRDEQFDVDQFGEWLEVLADTGDAVAARVIASLDTHVVIGGLSRYVRVFDPGTFEPTESSDDEPIDRHEKMNSETSADVVECEVGGYLVRGRRTDAWDAIVTLLSTLDAEHNNCFHAVMQGCRRLSNSRSEVDGLDNLLTAPEQHLHDVTVEREQRQSRRGYATPADARAFLQMARQPSPSTNPIARAYFRAAHKDEEAIPEVDIAASVDAAIALLTEAGVMPEPPRPLLEAGDEDRRAAKLPLLKRQMEFALHHYETAYLARGRELAFLANTLQAGCSVQSRPLTPHEAADAAASICNLGLERWGAGSLPETFLVEHDLVAVFEVGWSVLYEDVTLFVADQLIATLADLRCLDADIDRGLRELSRQLSSHRKAGTPWLARNAAEVLAMLDTTAWVSVLALLDECPVVPEALTAVLERRTTPVNATAFEFISTSAQVGDIRVFMRMLPDTLAG